MTKLFMNMLSTITQLGGVLCFIFANGTIPTITCCFG